MIGYGMNEVYVGELDPNVNEEILFSAFSRIGRIHSLKVMRHIVTGASRGFAFVNFFTPGEAARAVKLMDNEKLFGRKIKVFLKAEFDNLDANANIVFQNLPETATEEDIQKLLAGIANPFSIKIAKNEKKPEESKAFVQFANMDLANLAIGKLNGTAFLGRDLVVELTNRKNRVFVKAKYSDSAMGELKAQLAEWKFEESDTPELSTDKSSFIVLLKFENEDAAQRFLEDFRKDPKKCRLIRPHHHERRRQAEPAVAQGGLRLGEPEHLLQDHPLQGRVQVRRLQG